MSTQSTGPAPEQHEFEQRESERRESEQREFEQRESQQPDSQRTGTHQSVPAASSTTDSATLRGHASGNRTVDGNNQNSTNSPGPTESVPAYTAAHVAPRTTATAPAQGAPHRAVPSNGLIGAIRRSRVPATTRRLRRRGLNLFERARAASVNAATQAGINAGPNARTNAGADRGNGSARPNPSLGGIGIPANNVIADQPTSQVYASPKEMIDYRDRISVVTWLVVFGLGLSLIFSMPSLINFEWVIFTTPLAFELTDSVVASIFLAALAALGTQSVIEVHPSFATGRFSRWRSAVYWALPAALAIIATYLLPFAPNRPLQILGLLLSGIFIALSLFCLYATVEIGQPGFRRSRLVLNSLAYGSALLLFVFVYQTRTRSLVSATVISITATLLAVEVLRSTTLQASLVFTYGAIVGFVLGQVTWALNYWPVPNLTGGLLLLLIFYLLVGVAQQGLQERLTRRILLEFGIFTLVSLLLIALVGPGFST